MGVVYDGYDPTIDRRVAVKVILKSHAIDEALARDYSVRFVREARAAGRLNHPNIVQVYDFGEQEDIAYLVMEFIQGRELRSFFSAGVQFGIEESVRIMDELLSALDFAHEAGVIHRDVKPANVILDSQRRLKLADFGVARIQEGERSAVDTMVGTPAYMSPEQLSGRRIDRRTDLFSAGSILYQFLTGEQPFKGEGAWTLAKQIMQDDPPQPSSVAPSLPPVFDAIVQKALAKEPAERFASAREFGDALRGALAGRSPSTVVMAQEPKPRPARRPSDGEVEFWRSILNSADPAEFEFYLEQYPEGTYAQLARYKVAKLRGLPAEDAQATVRSADEQNARQQAEARSRREAEEKAKSEALEKAKREAQETAKRKAAEKRALEEAEARSRREAQEKAKKEALEKARREAEEKAKRDAEEKARHDRALAERRQQEEAAARAKAVADEHSTVAVRSRGPEVPAPGAHRISRALPPAAAVVALIAVAVGAYVFLGRTPAPAPVAQVPAPAVPPKAAISEPETDDIRKQAEARLRREHAERLAAEQAAAKAAADKAAQEKELALRAAAEKAAAQKAAREKLAAEQAAAEKAMAARVAAERAAAERAAAEKAAAQKAAAEKAAAEKAAAEKAAAAAQKAATERTAAEKAAAAERAAAEKAAAEKAAAAKAAAASALSVDTLFKQASALDREGKVAEAVRVYVQAARLGSGQAAKRLGDIYYDGAPGVARDYVESARWHNIARRRGVEVGPPGR
jgi:serine/threonine-protein kinase